MFKTYFWAVFFLGQLTFQTLQANEALSEELELSFFFDKQVLTSPFPVEIGVLEKPKLEPKREVFSPQRTSAELFSAYLSGYQSTPQLYRSLTIERENRWDLRHSYSFALITQF